jgi:hypothetical protein
LSETVLGRWTDPNYSTGGFLFVGQTLFQLSAQDSTPSINLFVRNPYAVGVVGLAETGLDL